jgi:N-methylhydantoinase A
MRGAVDIGGTFTDIVLYSEDSHRFCKFKISSDPQHPDKPFLEGILKALQEADAEISQIKNLRHGTTIVTNALLEGQGARTGLVVTEGFRDILEIGRQQRPELYDFSRDRPLPLVRRDYVMEIGERVSAEGDVLNSPDEEEIKEQLRALKDKNIEALAVGFLFSFLHPEHEKKVKAAAEKMLDIPVYLSHQISPEFREYERVSSTVIAAAVGPRVIQYLRAIQERLKKQGWKHDGLGLMHSGGGTITPEEAQKHPHTLVESGPAAGLIGAAALARSLELGKVLAFDMGGTTAKAGLIRNGAVEYTQEYEVGGDFHHGGRQRGSGYPIRSPMIDVVECGAGAGSIAWIDKGGHLKVGPRSAGADPGPACYGKGGDQPTVTDAHLLLGRLSPEGFLGGEMELCREPAQEAVESHLCRPLEMETEDAVSGIVDIANVSMLRILRVISVARGYDPRDFVLFAYGGAGPLHAVELAEKLSVTHVVIPRFPGIFSSLGLLFADMSMDFVETVMTDLNDLDSINQALSALKEEAEKWFNRNQPEDKEREMDAAGDLRYLHQNYELNVQLPGFKVKKEDVSRIRDEFDKTHEKSYGHSAPGEPVQAVNIRVRAVIKIPKPRLPELEKSNQAPEPSGRRKVRFGKEWIETAVYERKQLCSGQKIDGPSVIEETESTTLVGPGWRMEVDKWGHMHLKKSEK